MNWKSLAKPIGKIAPTLGLALAGTRGAFVGSLLAEYLQVDNKPIVVSDVLTNAEKRQKMLQWVSENEDMIAQFAEETALQRTKLRFKAAILVGSVLVVGFLSFVEIPESNQPVVNQLIGLLRAGAEIIIAQ